MTLRAALYVRDSLDDQSIADQLSILIDVARSNNWLVTKTYADTTIGYAKNKNSTDACRELCASLKQAEFDLVMVTSLDRIGRSMQELSIFLMDLQTHHVDIYCHKQGIDTTRAEDKCFFRMSDVFANFERSILKERVNAGIKRARDQGTKLGRPRVSFETEQAIRNYRSDGMGIKRIAHTLNIGVSVVQRVVGDALRDR
jgi:DNA invertase Pin-like site-specific DNA recombinase